VRIVGLVIWLLAAGAASGEASRVAILPVVVHTASPDPAYVSQGISDMLSARLEQIGGVVVLRVDDPDAATARLGPALERGRRIGADYVLFGYGASLDVQCAAVDDRAQELERNIFIQSGTVGEIIPQLDQLADKVVRFVGGAGSSEEPGSVAGVGSGEMRGFEERLAALEGAIFGAVGQAEVDAGLEEEAAEEAALEEAAFEAEAEVDQAELEAEVDEAVVESELEEALPES
jgi:hypothetical protein